MSAKSALNLNAYGTLQGYSVSTTQPTNNNILNFIVDTWTPTNSVTSLTLVTPAISDPTITQNGHSVTLPDPGVSGDTIMLVAATQTVSNKVINTTVLNGDVLKTDCFFCDPTDTSKRMDVSLSAPSTSTKTTLHFAQTGNQTVNFPNLSGASDTVAMVGQAQTFTSKTLTSPIINTPTINGSGGALTLPAGPTTLVGRDTTDTLTGKTLTSPALTSPVITSGATYVNGATSYSPSSFGGYMEFSTLCSLSGPFASTTNNVTLYCTRGGNQVTWNMQGYTANGNSSASPITVTPQTAIPAYFLPKPTGSNLGVTNISIHSNNVLGGGLVSISPSGPLASFSIYATAAATNFASSATTTGFDQWGTAFIGQ
jgi:hypothetical protein